MTARQPPLVQIRKFACRGDLAHLANLLAKHRLPAGGCALGLVLPRGTPCPWRPLPLLWYRDMHTTREMVPHIP